MKIISVTKTFRGEEFCIPSLESVYPYMHKMIYIHSDVSWMNQNGNTVAPLIEQWKKENDFWMSKPPPPPDIDPPSVPTRSEIEGKILNIYFDTNSQKAQYEKALEIANRYEYDYLMLIDTDEVWAEKDIKAAIEFLKSDTEHCGFKSAMYSYVKSPFFRVMPYDKLAPVVFIRKGAGINGCRGSKTEKQATIPGIEFHHFCSVRKSLTEVWAKHVASCTEEHEPMVDKVEWTKNVWNKLPNAVNLLPLKNHQANWPGAKRIGLEDLPESMRKHKFTLAFKDYNFNVNFKYRRYGLNEVDGGPLDYDVIVPTIKAEEDLADMLSILKDRLYKNTRIITTCLEASAATNRNYGIMECDKKYIVMLDDDIVDFPPMFAENLVKILRNNSNAVMVSARLCNADWTPGIMMNLKRDLSKEVVNVVERALPTACIAFRNDGTMFDERYFGSGFEDTDFSFELQKKYPNGDWLINNGVKVIHVNEMKNQHANGIYRQNSQKFREKWNNKLKQGEMK